MLRQKKKKKQKTKNKFPPPPLLTKTNVFEAVGTIGLTEIFSQQTGKGRFTDDHLSNICGIKEVTISKP